MVNCVGSLNTPVFAVKVLSETGTTGKHANWTSNSHTDIYTLARTGKDSRTHDNESLLDFHINFVCFVPAIHIIMHSVNVNSNHSAGFWGVTTKRPSSRQPRDTRL